MVVKNSYAKQIFWEICWITLCISVYYYYYYYCYYYYYYYYYFIIIIIIIIIIVFYVLHLVIYFCFTPGHNQWPKVLGRLCLCMFRFFLQPWTKYLRQTIVFNWNNELREKFIFHFSQIFCKYWQNFYFRRKTED